MKQSILIITLLTFYFVGAAGKGPLDSIQTIRLQGVSISVVEEVAEGINHHLPAYVRVSAVSQPALGSNIRIEVWMPQENWNGRFIGTGSGGGGGYIDYGSLEAGVRNGFAVANTDLGTSPQVDSLTFKPETWADFGFRATHEMTVVAKAVIEKYYGTPPRFSYFIGCSTGGQQAIMTAQRYPTDYNGILAGAPANNRTHLHTMFLWNYKLGMENPEHLFTRQQVESITKAVVAANVGKDGGYPGDNFLTDPRLAVFDPETLDTCLTSEQIRVLKQLYAGPVNPVTGEQIYTAMPLGSESAGSGLFDQLGEAIRYHLYPFLWANGLDFDPETFDFDKDMDRVDSILAPILNANSPDLEALKTSGGKIILYTGMSDPLVPPQDAIHYYDRVIDAQGSLENTQSFFRCFLIPGMHHCGGGPGPCNLGQGISNLSEDSEYNIFTALVKWVEKGVAPEHIIASAYNEEGEQRFSRPVFPYPLFPHYIPGKDPNLPSGYEGMVHERGKVPVPATKYLK
jgi:feruloyl esterase